MADLSLKIDVESQNAVGAIDKIGGAFDELTGDMESAGKRGAASMEEIEKGVQEVAGAVRGVDGTNLNELGNAAKDAAGDMRQTATSSEEAAKGLKDFSDNAGDADSIASALGGAISTLNPELGEAVSRIGEAASVLEAVTKAGKGWAVALGGLTLVAGALAIAYSKVKKSVEEAEAAQDAAAEKTARYSEAHSTLKQRLQDVKTALDLMNGALDEYDLKIRAADQANREASRGVITLAVEEREAARKKKESLEAVDVATLKTIGAIEKHQDALQKARADYDRTSAAVINLKQKRDDLTKTTTEAFEAERKRADQERKAEEAARRRAKWLAYRNEIEGVLLQLAAQRRSAAEDTLTDQEKIQVALEVEIEALDRLAEKYRNNAEVIATIELAKKDLIARSERDITNLLVEGSEEVGDAVTESVDGVEKQISALDQFREKLKALFPAQTKTRAQELEETISNIQMFLAAPVLIGKGSIAEVLAEFGPQLKAAKEELEEINRLAAMGNFGLSQEQQVKASGLTDQITNAFISGGASLLQEIPGLAGQIVQSVFDLGKLLMEEEGAEKVAQSFADTIGAFEAILTELGPLIEALVPAIAESVLNLLKAIPEAIPKAMDGLVASIEELLDGGFVGNLIEALGNIIPALIRGLIDIFITIYIEIPKVILKHILGGLKDVIVDIGSGIAGFFRAFKEDWRGAFRDLGASIKNFFKDLIGGVVEFVKSLLPDFITDRVQREGGIFGRAGDLYSPPNNQDRFYVGPEGSFKLSPNDTVMAVSSLRSPQSSSGSDENNNVIQLVLSADVERLGFGLDPIIQQGIRQKRINTQINPSLVLRDPLSASGI